MNPEDIISALRLKPHPEGGWYRETYRALADEGVRSDATAIYYFLKSGESSRWHRVLDADEIWTWHAGTPLQLSISQDGRTHETIVLGADLAAGESPQAVVPRGSWQAAEPLGEWCLVSCIVAPGFEFDKFEMAPDNWRPGDE